MRGKNPDCNGIIIGANPISNDYAFFMTQSAATIRRLEVFRAVMETGTATGAARQLGLSQPAVSQQLAQLEETLDVALFLRDRGRLVPTSEAIDLFAEVDQALDSLERVVNAAHDLRSREPARLRLAVPHSLCNRLIPQLVGEMLQAYPNLRITVGLGTYGEILGAVAARRSEIGITKGAYEHVGVSSLPLMSVPLKVVLTADHALVRAAAIRPADLAGEPLILHGRETMTRAKIEHAFSAAKIVPNVRIDTVSAGSACAFVRQGLGLCIVSGLMADQYTDEFLVTRPFEPVIEDRFRIIWPAAMRQSGLIEDVAEKLRTLAAAQNQGGPGKAHVIAARPARSEDDRDRKRPERENRRLADPVSSRRRGTGADGGT